MSLKQIHYNTEKNTFANNLWFPVAKEVKAREMLEFLA